MTSAQPDRWVVLDAAVAGYLLAMAVAMIGGMPVLLGVEWLDHSGAVQIVCSLGVSGGAAFVGGRRAARLALKQRRLAAGLVGVLLAFSFLVVAVIDLVLNKPFSNTAIDLSYRVALLSVVVVAAWLGGYGRRSRGSVTH